LDCAAAISLLPRKLFGFAVIYPIPDSVQDRGYRGRFDFIPAHRIKKRDGLRATCFSYVNCGVARPRLGFGIPLRVNGYAMIFVIDRAHFLAQVN
jgi:hypothetical protein